MQVQHHRHFSRLCDHLFIICGVAGFYTAWLTLTVDLKIFRELQVPNLYANVGLSTAFRFLNLQAGMGQNRQTDRGAMRMRPPRGRPHKTLLIHLKFCR